MTKECAANEIITDEIQAHAELAFINSVDPKAVGRMFNWDFECFSRYCLMQSNRYANLEGCMAEAMDMLRACGGDTAEDEIRAIKRKLRALEIDMAGECSHAHFLAMCERYDMLHEKLAALYKDA